MQYAEELDTPVNYTFWGKGGVRQMFYNTREKVHKVFSGKEINDSFNRAPAESQGEFKRAPTESQGEFKNMGDMSKGVFEGGLKEKKVQENQLKLSRIPEKSHCMIRKIETVIPYGVSAYDPITLKEVEKMPRGTKIDMKRGDSIRTITTPSGKKEAYVYITAKSDTKNPYAKHTDSGRLFVRASWLDSVVNKPLSAESLSKAVIAYAQMRAKEIEECRQRILQEQKQGKSAEEIKRAAIFQEQSKNIERSKIEGLLPLIQYIQKNGYSTNTTTITYSGEFIKGVIDKAKSNPQLGGTIKKIAYSIQGGNQF